MHELHVLRGSIFLAVHVGDETRIAFADSILSQDMHKFVYLMGLRTLAFDFGGKVRIWHPQIRPWTHEVHVLRDLRGSPALAVNVGDGQLLYSRSRP